MDERFRILAELSTVGVFESDLEGNVLYVNQGWATMAGISAAEARGRG